MEKRKMLILAIASALIIGGTIVAVQNKDLFGGIAQQKYQSAEEKQLAYLKEHEEEIVNFVKSKSSKVESVQIYWDETQWIDGGNGTPQGGDEVIEIFGTVNQLEDSGWRVDVVFDSDQKMTFSMGYNISIKGDYIE